MKYRLLTLILWPSFLVAGLAEGILFSVMDPQDIALFGNSIEATPEAVYTVGFFVLWILCSISSGLTYFVMPAADKEGNSLS